MMYINNCFKILKYYLVVLPCFWKMKNNVATLRLYPFAFSSMALCNDALQVGILSLVCS